MIFATVAVAVAVPVLMGALILARSTQRRVGWLLVAHGVCVGMLLAPALLPDTLAWPHAADRLTQGAWVFLFLWLVLIAYLLPDGKAPSRFWKAWIGVGLIGVVIFNIGAVGGSEGPAGGSGAAVAPWLPPGVFALLGIVGLLVIVAFIFGSAIAVAYRLRRASGEVRLQLLWLVWGSLSVPAGLLVLWGNHFGFGDHEWLTYPVLAFASIALPLAIAAAILKHQLFDIRLVLSRSLTYGALTLFVLAVYGLGIAATDRVFRGNAVGGVLAVAIVAVAIHPMATYLRRRIERWVYGYRSAPAEALRLLADRAENSEPAKLSASITAAVAQALKIDRVWITLDEVDNDQTRIPLVHRGQRLGDLVVEVPAGRELSAADVSLLRDLARYAAVLVYAEQLNKDLQQSRSRIVMAREEERRRLRRDLHDGLGPSLAAMVLKLNAAQSRSDATERNALLAETRNEVKETIAEVRRLVDDLRPPAIDEVGLIAAIRQRAAALAGEVAVDVEAPETLPPLPAAVEVAAFRIVSEAMTNVARHSGASRCRVSVELGAGLQLTVSDNGRGIAKQTSHGVGWTSMRARAAELGGTLAIYSRAEGGLVVHAVLPSSEQPDPRAEVTS